MSGTEYLAPFHFRCGVCARVHFMERDADRCCPPIKWVAPEPCECGEPDCDCASEAFHDAGYTD